MQLDAVTMDRTEARRAAADYVRAVRERHDQEDAEILRAYRAISRGQQLIRLSSTIGAGGLETIKHEHMRWAGGRREFVTDEYVVPRLAVARADAKEVWTFGVARDGRIEMRSKQTIAPNNRRDRMSFRVEADEARPDVWWNEWNTPNVRAMVPIVPPPLRPAHKLSGYHVLWEAEWSVVSPPVPEDPALLKRISGDLFAVVAIWDLTEVERLVLAGRSAPT